MADYTPSDDGYGIKSGNTSGANVAEKLLGSRNSGTAYSMIESGYGGASQSHYIGPRPITSVNYFSIIRAHMIFDLSSASGTVTAATLKVYAATADAGGTINNGQKFYVVGHDYGGDLNNVSDDVNPTNNTTGDWTSTSVPTYSSEITVNGVSQGDLISVTLNSDAITAINSAVGSGDFDIGLVGNDDYKADYTISTYGDGFGYNGVQISTQNHSTSAQRPVLSLTTGTPDTSNTISTIDIKAGSVNIKGGVFTIK